MSVTAIALVGVPGVAACSGHIADSTPASNGTNFVSGDGTATYYQPGHRTAAPAVSGTTLSGRRLSLSSYHGHVVVLNFWGSWCAPCRKEAPTLEVLSQEFQSKGVQFVGVDIRDQTAAAQAFVQNFSIGYPSLNDSSDQIALAFRTTVPPEAIPSTLVIDQQDHIAGRIIGAVSSGSLDSMLSRLTAGT